MPEGSVNFSAANSRPTDITTQLFSVKRYIDGNLSTTSLGWFLELPLCKLQRAAEYFPMAFGM